MMYVAIASMVILAAFIGLSVWQFGILESYSSYARKWKERFPNADPNIWSAVTVIAAILMAIAFIGKLDGNPLQFLGFLAPVYLGVVACTPNYYKSNGQRIAHYLGTFCSAIAFLSLVIFGFGLWWLPLTWAAAFLFFLGLPTKSVTKSWELWVECAIFATAFTVLLADVSIGG